MLDNKYNFRTVTLFFLHVVQIINRKQIENDKIDRRNMPHIIYRQIRRQYNKAFRLIGSYWIWLMFSDFRTEKSTSKKRSAGIFAYNLQIIFQQTLIFATLQQYYEGASPTPETTTAEKPNRSEINWRCNLWEWLSAVPGYDVFKILCRHAMVRVNYRVLLYPPTSNLFVLESLITYWL